MKQNPGGNIFCRVALSMLWLICGCRGGFDAMPNPENEVEPSGGEIVDQEHHSNSDASLDGGDGGRVDEEESIDGRLEEWEEYREQANDNNDGQNGCNVNAMTHTSEFQVNTAISVGDQGHPSVLRLANGNYVLLYGGLWGDESIHGRIVDRYGVERVADWVISSGPFDMTPYGVDLGGDRFLVVWDNNSTNGPILARVYHYDGTAEGDGFQVSEGNAFFDDLSAGGGYGTDRFGIHPVDVLSAGRVVFTYIVEGDEAMVRMFDVSTIPPMALHASLPVSQAGLNISAVSVMILSDGNFMAIWNDGWAPSIFTRVYDPGAIPPTAVTSQLDSIPAFISSVFDWSLLPIRLHDGTPVLAFTGSHPNTGMADGDSYGTYAVRFTKNGTAVRDLIRLNTTTAGAQYNPVLCPLGDGGMVAAWTGEQGDGDGQAFVGQIFNADLTKIGSEFIINDTTAGDQVGGSLACGVDEFVATWVDQSGMDGDGNGIFAKAYAGACSSELPNCPATGIETTVNQYTPGDDFTFNAARLSDDRLAVTHTSGEWWGEMLYVTQHDSLGNPIGGAYLIQDVDNSVVSNSMIPLNDGKFVVTWGGWDLGSNGCFGIRARIFDADFNPVGGSFLVSPYEDNQSYPAGVVLNANNDWAVAYTRSLYEVMFQRYDAQGNALGAAARVNHDDYPVEGGVGVEKLSGGDFIVIWQQDDGSLGNVDIYGRVYHEGGIAVGAQFMVNTTTANDQKFTDANDTMYNFDPVAWLSQGGFVVVWSSDNQDGSGFGVFGQIFDPASNPPSKTGGEFIVNTTTSNHQNYASVSAFDDGGFVVTWQSFGQDGSDYGVYAQRFYADGTKNGGEIQVNDTTQGTQGWPMVTTLANGTYLVGYAAENFDGSGFGVASKIVGTCTLTP